MAGYTKLFNSIVASTIWREDDKTRIVWITMLALCDKNGNVEASVPGLADFARVSIPECERALERLAAPDTYSRSQNDEGRRIRPIHGGWFLINFPVYREKMNKEERTEYNRIKQAESRAARAVNDVSNVNDKSALSAHSEASTSTSTSSTPDPAPSDLQLEPPSQGRTTRSTDVDRTRFETFWKAYPRKVGKDAAWKVWQRRKLTHEVTLSILAAVELQKTTEQWQRDGGQFIPHPSTWLNQGRWQDEPTTALATRAATSPYGEKARRTKEAGERLMKKMGVK